MKSLRRLAVVGFALWLTACGAIDADPARCTPACTAPDMCCSEPNHSLTDGGISSWVCVRTSGPLCPKQP